MSPQEQEVVKLSELLNQSKAQNREDQERTEASQEQNLLDWWDKATYHSLLRNKSNLFRRLSASNQNWSKMKKWKLLKDQLFKKMRVHH